MRNRSRLGQVTGAALAVLVTTATACRPADSSVFIGPLPFEEVADLSSGVTPVAFPTVDLVASYPAGSPLARVSQLAVSGDGVVAMGHSSSCTVLLIPEGMDAPDVRIDACGEGGRGISDLFWIDGQTLGVYDQWSGEIRTFDSAGAEGSRLEVPQSEPGGVFSAVYPVDAATSVITAFEPISEERVHADPRLVQRRDRRDGEVQDAFLALPEVGLRDDLMFPFGVEVCVEQAPKGTARVLALNRWAHEVYVIEPGVRERAGRSVYRHDVPLFAGGRPNGLLAPQQGSFGLGCGEGAGLAHRTIHHETLSGEIVKEGVLDWISFDGALLGRFDLTTAADVDFTRELGVSRDGVGFALVRHDGGLALARFELRTERLAQGEQAP
ncbi:MAG: hypothetical protein AAF389_03595 [Gemmatimonadota bacterium]